MASTPSHFIETQFGKVEVIVNSGDHAYICFGEGPRYKFGERQEGWGITVNRRECWGSLHLKLANGSWGLSESYFSNNSTDSARRRIRETIPVAVIHWLQLHPEVVAAGACGARADAIASLEGKIANAEKDLAILRAELAKLKGGE